MNHVSLRNETPEAPRCAAADCGQPLTQTATGRPARYCSPACRARAHRHRQLGPAVAETMRGSASSRGRHPDTTWLVQLRRGDRAVIVAIGLRRSAADRLVEQLNDLLTDMPT